MAVLCTEKFLKCQPYQDFVKIRYCITEDITKNKKIETKFIVKFY